MGDDAVKKFKVRDEVKYYPEYWAGKKLAYPHVPPQHPKFARSVVVGNLIFISGCQGQNDESLEIPLTFEEQMVNALDKVKKAVEEAGSSMNNIIKTLIFLKNLEDYPRMRKTELEYYQKYAPSLVENPPASTVAIVASLARPEFLVEIDAIGYIP
ncbi:MAG: RidA family protein [Candidatus Bathyarchaeia archaeon]